MTSVEELSRLSWSREVIADSNGVWLASVPELKGCFAEGNSIQEALSELEEVLPEWLAIAVEEGWELPQPRNIDSESFERIDHG